MTLYLSRLTDYGEHSDTAVLQLDPPESLEFFAVLAGRHCNRD